MAVTMRALVLLCCFVASLLLPGQAGTTPSRLAGPACDPTCPRGFLFPVGWEGSGGGRRMRLPWLLELMAALCLPAGLSEKALGAET